MFYVCARAKPFKMIYFGPGGFRGCEAVHCFHWLFSSSELVGLFIFCCSIFENKDFYEHVVFTEWWVVINELQKLSNDNIICGSDFEE